MLRRFRLPGTIWLIAALLTMFPAVQFPHAQGITTEASPAGPAQTAYAPASGHGRVVIIVSGHSGPDRYEFYAAAVARLGYYVVLLDGNDIFSPDRQGSTRLFQAIARAQQSPQAVPGKVAVIGFSQGGGGALAYAARMARHVAVVIAYYPVTAFFSRDMANVVDAMKVPVLAFAGAQDTFHNCCLIDTARAMATEAKQLGRPFELIVYPDAAHDFNLKPGNDQAGIENGIGFNRAARDDAWRRTKQALQTYLGG